MDVGRYGMNEFDLDHRRFDNAHNPLGAWDGVRWART